MQFLLVLIRQRIANVRLMTSNLGHVSFKENELNLNINWQLNNALRDT